MVRQQRKREREKGNDLNLVNKNPDEVEKGKVTSKCNLVLQKKSEVAKQ